MPAHLFRGIDAIGDCATIAPIIRLEWASTSECHNFLGRTMALSHSSRRAKNLLHVAVIECLEERRLFDGGPNVQIIPWFYTALSLLAKAAGDPVSQANGSLILNRTDIQSNGFGSAMGVSRSWTNSPGFQMSSGVGNGWDMNQNPQILQPLGSSGPLQIVTSASKAKWFSNSSGTYKEYFDGHDQLSYNSTSDIYTLTDQTGNQTTFYGFSNSSYGIAGAFASYTPASGSTISVVSHNSSTGAITEEDRSETAGGVTTTESLVYTYFPSGNPNVGELQSVKLNRSTGSSVATVRQVVYGYYGDGTGDTSSGNTNDLRTATVEDASGNVLSEDYYRYYIAGSGSGDELKYEFTATDFARMQAGLPSTETPFTAPDSDAAHYATLSLTYNSCVTVAPGVPSASGTAYSQTLYQVATEYVAGAGRTDGTGIGQGEYTFSYSANSTFATNINNGSLVLTPEGSGTSAQFNQLAYTTVETTPSGLVNTYDMNYAGETTIEQSTPSDGSGTRYAYSQYNSQGRVTEKTDSIAIGAVDMAGGVVTTFESSVGEFDYLTYYSGTSGAGESTAGSADGYLQSETASQGSAGTTVSVEAFDYKSHTANGVAIYYLADDTVYQNANGTGDETTSYQYNYSSSSFSPTKLVTTLPTITTAQNGPNSATADTKFYTADGQVQWELNPNGNISFDAYNVSTGALALDIQDLTAADSSYSSTYGTSPWTIPASDGFVLATQYAVDDQGRTTDEISPNGNITYTTYDDINHETRVYPGWHYDSSISKYTTTGPVQVMRDDWAHGYVDSYSYAYSPATGITVPHGNDSTGTLTAFTRDITNTSAQVTEEDRYFNLSGVSYSTSTAHPGTLNTNYYATFFAYDAGGNQDRVLAPTGTIKRTVFDQYDEPISTWIGAVIGGAADDSAWPTAGNMVEVSAATYDKNGNQTEMVQYPGGGASGRATMMYYDFRDRLIAEMDGAIESSMPPAGGTADTGSNDTFVSYYTLDNLGQATESDTYNAEGHTPTSGSTPVTGMALTAASTKSYDNLGRVFSSAVISVDPATHAEGTTDTTYNYYDADGNLIATISPTGSATKYVFNGAGWNTFTYATDGGQLNNASNSSIGSSTAYAAAGSVAGDIVLSQSQPIYDNDGNVIETISKDRFGTDSTGNTLTGALGTPTSGVEARVSYSASYYDAADRDMADVNVGTNGGSAWTPPAYSVLARSGTELLTTYVYDPAGNIAFVTDPMGISNATGYDALGRTIITVANWTPVMGPIDMSTLGTLSDSSNVVTEYTYDGDNHVTSMTAVLPSGEASQTTTYLYGVTKLQGSTLDSNDLLYEVQYPDPTTGESGTGWTYSHVSFGASGVSGNDSGYTGGADAAPEGSQVGFIQAYGYISQQANFSAGTYTISFSAAQRSGSSQDFEVFVDGNAVGTFTPSGSSYESDATSSFTVSAGMHTITFLGLDTAGGDNTAFIDNVQVSDAGGTTATPPALVDAGFESPSVGSGDYWSFAVDPSQGDVYTYNNLGQQTTSDTDRNGTQHSYTYDMLNRLTSDQVTVFAYGLSNMVDMTVAELGYTYTDAGQLSTATSYDSSSDVLNQVQETYDGFSQLTNDVQAHTGTVADTSPPSVGYSYSASNGDRLTGITYPSGRTVNYNYSSGLDSVLSRISSITDSGGSLQSYTYLGLSTPVTFTDGNGTKLTYGATGSTGLDQFGRVVDQNWQNSSGTSIDDFQYSYDANSNVLSRYDAVNPGNSETYTYDNLNRLTGMNRGTTGDEPTFEMTWNLDALGNWHSAGGDSGETSRANNAQNQITSQSSDIAGSGGSGNFTYDPNGNLTSQPDGQTYFYDAWNRLVDVNTGSDVVSYTYDALGRRITETDNNTGVTTDNYFSGQNLIEQQQSGTTTSQFVWGPFYVNQLVQETSSSGTFYVQQDANWNITSISNSSGGVVERYQYDPYGGIIVLSAGGTAIGAGISSSTVGQIIGFQGGWTDPITGLVHFQMRDLNTGLGRWIQQDPIGAAGSGTNLYQLDVSNPAKYTDPFGLAKHTDASGLDSGPGPSNEPIYGPPDDQPTPAPAGPTIPYPGPLQELIPIWLDLERRKNDSFTKTNGQGDATTDWLWQQIGIIKQRMAEDQDMEYDFAQAEREKMGNDDYTPPPSEKHERAVCSIVAQLATAPISAPLNLVVRVGLGVYTFGINQGWW
jgi:RHS repeat-associated protein